MGLWDRVKAGLQIVVGGHSQGRVIVKGVTQNAGHQQPKQGEAWLHGYNTMPWLRANAAKIAQGVASLEWGITRTMDVAGMTVKRPDIQKGSPEYRRKALAALEEEGKAEAIFDHPFLTLWKNPCPALPGHAARKLAQVYYDVVGEVFFVVDRGPRDGWIKSDFTGRPLPTALWPIPAMWVKRFPTPDNPTFEIRHAALQLNDIPMSEVLWLKDPDPVNPYGRGVGLFNSLSDELDSDENAARMISYSFYNRNRPDVLVSLPQATDGELQAFRNDWVANLQGVQNTLKSHFVNVEAEVQQIGYDFREMQVIDLRRHTRDTIRQVPGVPPEMLGIQDQSNRSTIEAAEFIFNKHVIEPRAEVWREFLSSQLLVEYDPRAVLDYVSPVQEDKNFTLNVATGRPEVMRVNEVRKLAGLPALTEAEGGNLFYVNGSFVPSLAQAPAANAMPGAPAGPGGGLSQPGFEGGINVPGAPKMHLSVPGAAGSAESVTPAPVPPPATPPPPMPPTSGSRGPAPFEAAPKDPFAKEARLAGRRFRGSDQEFSPDQAILVAKWAKALGYDFDLDLVLKSAPIPLSDKRGEEWARRALAHLAGRSTKAWDSLLGPWSEEDTEILDAILSTKGWDEGSHPRAEDGRFTDGSDTRPDGDGGDGHTPSGRAIIEGKFLNQGKVSVRYGSGPSDTTGFHANEADAHAEADKILADREAHAKQRRAEDQILSAHITTGRGDSRQAEDALGRRLGGKRATRGQIAGFIRGYYRSTLAEAERHASRVLNRHGYIDTAGTQRAHVRDVLTYLREYGNTVERKKTVKVVSIRKGDFEGHPFRGNQYTTEAGGEGESDTEGRQRRARNEARELRRQDAGARLHADLKANGGFTFDPKTATSPKDGFMVSLYKDRERVIEGHASASDIAKYERDNEDLLSKPGHHLGGWYNEGKTYLDVSVRSETAEEANKLARENNQLAYFDLATFTEHKTKGITKHLAGTEFDHDQSDHATGGGGGDRSQGGSDQTQGGNGVSGGIEREPKSEVSRSWDPDVESDKDGDGVTDSARVGVPADEVPPPPTVPRLPNLTPHERMAENAFASAYEADPDGTAQAFREMVNAAGQPAKFEADMAKMLFAEWRGGEGDTLEQRAEVRATLNTALHQTADAIAKRAFLMHLDTMSEEDRKKGLLVTVGGVGAGKGFALKNLAKAGFTAFDSKNYGVIWDSAGDQNATENPWLLAEASKRGIPVTYAYVSADPETSWADPARGVVQRAKDPKDGRMVDAKVFADSYALGARNHAAFSKANAGKATFVYVRNGKTQDRLEGVPESDLKLDRRRLHDFAVETIARLGDDVPPRIKRGALVGQRIWPTGRHNKRRSNS